MVGMKARVDDELNRLGTEFSNLGNNLVGQRPCARIDHQGALRSTLDSDIGAISYQHVATPCNMKHTDCPVVATSIGRAAGLLLFVWNPFAFCRCCVSSGDVCACDKLL